jgi:hypothetical protein
MKYDIKISIGQPSDIAQWDALAIHCGNLIQHTSTAGLDRFFNNQSAYIEIFSAQILVGAYRFNFFESKRLPPFLRSISRSATFWGEALYNENFPKEEITVQIDTAIKKYLLEHNPVKYKFTNYYGSGISPAIFKTPTAKQFGMAIIDLTCSEEVLWEKVHSKHRNSIRKAEKSGVVIQVSDDIATFINLMKATYEGQDDKTAPNFQYITEQYKLYSKQGNAILYIAYQEGIAYNGALVTLLGDRAYYAFAGTVKNPWAAGNLTQWFIIKHLKERGLKSYSLGQVALDGESNFGDDKFVSGISTFKMRFGPAIEKGISVLEIRRPFANTIWNFLVKLLMRT